jgi:hypothetical protein
MVRTGIWEAFAPRLTRLTRLTQLTQDIKSSQSTVLEEDLLRRQRTHRHNATNTHLVN